MAAEPGAEGSSSSSVQEASSSKEQQLDLRAALSPSLDTAAHSLLAARTEHLTRLSDLFASSTASARARSLVIAGQPGVGKTATVDYALKLASDKGELTACCTVNCSTLLGGGADAELIERIASGLELQQSIKAEGKKNAKSTVVASPAALEQALRLKPGNYVVVLDEVDSLLLDHSRRTQGSGSIASSLTTLPSALAAIYNLAHDAQLFALVAIANTLDIALALPRPPTSSSSSSQPLDEAIEHDEGLTDESKREMLANQRGNVLLFAPYSAAELVTIATARLARTANGAQLLNPMCVRLAAARVASVKGDVRALLGVLSRALDLAAAADANTEPGDDEAKRTSRKVTKQPPVSMKDMNTITSAFQRDTAAAGALGGSLASSRTATGSNSGPATSDDPEVAEAAQRASAARLRALFASSRLPLNAQAILAVLCAIVDARHAAAEREIAQVQQDLANQRAQLEREEEEANASMRRVKSEQQRTPTKRARGGDDADENKTPTKRTRSAGLSRTPSSSSRAGLLRTPSKQQQFMAQQQAFLNSATGGGSAPVSLGDLYAAYAHAHGRADDAARAVLQQRMPREAVESDTADMLEGTDLVVRCHALPSTTGSGSPSPSPASASSNRSRGGRRGGGAGGGTNNALALSPRVDLRALVRALTRASYDDTATPLSATSAAATLDAAQRRQRSKDEELARVLGNVYASAKAHVADGLQIAAVRRRRLAEALPAAGKLSFVGSQRSGKGGKRGEDENEMDERPAQTTTRQVTLDDDEDE